MAELELEAQTWTEVYAGTGIAASTAIYIQNKGEALVYVSPGSEPTANSKVGWLLQMGDTVQIPAGSSTVYAKAGTGDSMLYVVAS